jgi:hypothetical protein
MSILDKFGKWLFYKDTSGLMGFVKMCIFLAISFTVMSTLIFIFVTFAVTFKMLLGIS